MHDLIPWIDEAGIFTFVIVLSTFLVKIHRLGDKIDSIKDTVDAELKLNGGTSVKDKVIRLDESTKSICVSLDNLRKDIRAK